MIMPNQKESKPLLARNHNQKKQFSCTILLFLINLIIYISRHVQLVNASGHHHHHYHHQQSASDHQDKQLDLPKILIPDLPPKHYQFWLKNNQRALSEYKEICAKYKQIESLDQFKELHQNMTIENPLYLNDFNYGKSFLDTICSTVKLAHKSCWGYENNCQIIHLMPECIEEISTSPGNSRSHGKSVQEKKINWFSTADFGYIMERRKEIARFCSPDKFSNDTVKSSLECTRYFKTCRAENIMIKFNDIPKSGSLITDQPSGISSSSIISKGQIGGWNCDLQLKRIQEETGQLGALQSWFNELKDYNKLGGSGEDACDITIDKQAYILKLDSPFNMYHYFCNFLNLYATMHLNNRFSSNNQIIIWDNHLPKSKFELLWSAFSRNKPMSLNELKVDGKKVCFKKAIFTLLPRMIDGLYYNTPLAPGCSKSGLFAAFNRHILYKLNIQQSYDLEQYIRNENKLIRVTIISRTTSYRKILNEKKLLSHIEGISNDYQVNLIDYSKLDMKDQLKLSQNTDILIGIHGAGLTNCLFLPDWAAVIELNDCNDKCYHDLSRLRGVNYYKSGGEHIISERHSVQEQSEIDKLTKSKLLEHEKFSNYKIILPEFSKLLDKAIEQVRLNRKRYFESDENTQNRESQSQDEKNTQIKDDINIKHDEL